MALRPRKFQKTQEEHKTIEISAGMQGSLTFQDPVDLKINGSFLGSLETKGTLSIGEASIVEANISGDSIIIAGKVTGNIIARKMLVLMPNASLHGDISTAKLNIVEGAIFQGNCQMTDDLLDIEEVSKYLEIDTPEIEKLVLAGSIPGIRNGDMWKFERHKIDDWAASGRLK